MKETSFCQRTVGSIYILWVRPPNSGVSIIIRETWRVHRSAEVFQQGGRFDETYQRVY